MSLNERVQISCGLSEEDAKLAIDYVVENLRGLIADNDLRYGDLDNAAAYLGLEPEFIPLIMVLLV